MMNLLQLFTQYSPSKVFLAILTGAVSGIAYSLLIPLLMTSLAPTESRLPLESLDPYLFFGIEIAHPRFAILFFILCILILIARTISQVLLARISMDVTSKLRRSLYDRISNTPISCLEKNNDGRLTQIMATDVQNIVKGAGIIPDVLVQSSTVLGLMFFLYYLNEAIFVFVLFTIIFGVITFQLPIIIGTKYFKKSRYHMDLLQESFKGLIEGAKELKLNRDKHAHFMEHQLFVQERNIVKLEKTGYTIVRIARNYGDLLCFFATGFIGFVFINYRAISTVELTGVLMVLLYITGPLAFILNVLPELAQAKISLARVQSLFNELPVEQASKKLHIVNTWRHINLKAIGYRHVNGIANENGFGIGPIDAQIKRGEITFIVGGNGSGKSTLLKLVSLHYPAVSGEIDFEGVAITPENVNSYRAQIACIYSDFYLFKQLHVDYANNPEIEEQINYYLCTLELHGKVSFKDGCFSTLKLSDGQRRRLALLVAFLDNKELYVFDEWAADQDPNFKKIFYLEILPRLKAQGKSVVAISHDDRYFHVADKILVMEDGRIAESVPQHTSRQHKLSDEQLSWLPS